MSKEALIKVFRILEDLYEITSSETYAAFVYLVCRQILGMEYESTGSDEAETMMLVFHYVLQEIEGKE